MVSESTVNEVVSKRMVKNQQMRWNQKGAHLLLQVRIKTLNHELGQSFCRWYPKMEQENDASLLLAACPPVLDGLQNIQVEKDKQLSLSSTSPSRS